MLPPTTLLPSRSLLPPSESSNTLKRSAYMETATRAGAAVPGATTRTPTGKKAGGARSASSMARGVHRRNQKLTSYIASGDSRTSESREEVSCATRP
eukprot:scaffold30249_cov66-Phaeocystis_antarctica.AAC.2